MRDYFEDPTVEKLTDTIVNSVRGEVGWYYINNSDTPSKKFEAQEKARLILLRDYECHDTLPFNKPIVAATTFDGYEIHSRITYYWTRR
jgi:hypothetical protein